MALLLILVLTACAAPPTENVPGNTIAVTDALGRQARLAGPPQRIVVTGRAPLMIVDALYLFPEAPSRVAALARTAQNERDFIPVVDPHYADKIILEAEAGAEQIAAARPDLVLLRSSQVESLGKSLESLGTPVVYLDFETPEQYRRDLTTLGQILQNETRAEELIAFFQVRVARVTRALTGLPAGDRPRVLLIYYSDRDGQVAFNVPPVGWIQTWMAETAGGQAVWKDAALGQGWTKVTLEQIAAWDADQIYVVAYTTDVDRAVERLKADPQWQALRAVQEGRLYAFPGDYYSWDQPDPRWILGLAWMAGKIHPERLADLNMEQEMRTFFREMYRMDGSVYEKQIQPKLIGDLP